MSMTGSISSGSTQESKKITGSTYGFERKNISQEGIDKIIYDIMSSDKGLASLGSLENSSGGFGASDKTLMAQDLMAKLAGEIALVTAETEKGTTTGSTERDKSSNIATSFTGKDSVICTELVRQGKFSKELYHGGHSHFLGLRPETVLGYQFWAKPIAARMVSSPWLYNFFLPIVQARYAQIVNGKRSLLGSGTIYLGQPLCFLIGSMISLSNKLTGAFRGNRTEQSA